MGEDAMDIEQLYQAHGSALLGYLRRSFGPGVSPDDLLQETFLQALRGREQLARAVSQRAWLFGIARHVGLTAMRRNRPLETFERTEPVAPEPNVELQAMREAITQLPVHLREALELRLRDGLSYEEIAVVLQIPIGTVRSRLHSAVRRLGEILEPEPDRRINNGTRDA
jgi:RNA polymerase sigma-70 factor (ECF subfamily)